MQHPPDLLELESEVAGLKARREALRQAAALPGSELGPVLEAAFTELDGAIEALSVARSRPAGQDAPAARAALLAERRLLRAAFQDAPVPLFLLGRDAAVHRVNSSAGNLLGLRPGYATGKLFTAFVDLPSRAAVHSQLAAVTRTGKPRKIDCSLLSAAGTVPSELTIGLVRLRGDTDQLIVSASRRAAGADTGQPAGPAAGQGRGKSSGKNSGPTPDVAAGQARGQAPGVESARLVEAMTHRFDLATAATRLLLENATFSESVTLQRCARLLASELPPGSSSTSSARQRLRRQFVMGPR